jgi:F0F1-type ATP synthase assembly protein I
MYTNREIKRMKRATKIIVAFIFGFLLGVML